MNKNDTIKRYAILMFIGVILNFGLYYIAHTFHLPLWMDSIGTVYTAMALEPAAGLLIGFVSNFYEATFIYDSSSLIYYAVSAATALIVGVGLRKNGEIHFKRIFLTLFCYIVVSTLLSAGITVWRTGGIPDSGWEKHFMGIAQGWGLSKIPSCFFGTLVLRINDALLMLVALPLLYRITPKKLITIKTEQIVSWKNPFWVRSTDR